MADVKQIVADTLRTMMGATAAEPYIRAIEKAIDAEASAPPRDPDDHWQNHMRLGPPIPPGTGGDNTRLGPSNPAYHVAVGSAATALHELKARESNGG